VGDTTSISWCDATFNPWSGCTRISPACANCYAAALPPGMRRHAEWGDGHPRILASDAYWKQPLAWDRKAAREGRRIRVFCGSTCDVFEPRIDLEGPRWRLWSLIERTPNLDWLLLTKRPWNMVAWARHDGWPSNAWAGVTVENQATADARIPLLLQVPARVRFVSAEPLLGPVNICAVPDHKTRPCEFSAKYSPLGDLSWLIVGGESGPHARPMHPDWVRGLRDQAVGAGVAFHFKQWGEWAPWTETNRGPSRDDVFLTPDGVARDPAYPWDGGMFLSRVGRAHSGHLLDGREWREVPHA